MLSNQNLDRRGIPRGKCKVADCDCSEFERHSEAGCGYCGHFPANHSAATKSTESGLIPAKRSSATKSTESGLVAKLGPKNKAKICFACGQPGHIASSCPNGSKSAKKPQHVSQKIPKQTKYENKLLQTKNQTTQCTNCGEDHPSAQCKRQTPESPYRFSNSTDSQHEIKEKRNAEPKIFDQPQMRNLFQQSCAAVRSLKEYKTHVQCSHCKEEGHYLTECPKSISETPWYRLADDKPLKDQRSLLFFVIAFDWYLEKKQDLMFRDINSSRLQEALEIGLANATDDEFYLNVLYPLFYCFAHHKIDEKMSMATGSDKWNEIFTKTFLRYYPIYELCNFLFSSFLLKQTTSNSIYVYIHNLAIS